MYSKHSLTSREYVSKKIVVIRHVEVKISQQKWIFCQNLALKARSQIPLWKFGISNFSRNFEIFFLGKYLSKNNFEYSVWKLRIYTFWIYHRNLLCLILYCFTKELRTTGCFGKSENMSTSNVTKTTWKWGQVIMIIPEVKSMDLQLSNGVSTSTTR